MAQDKTTGRLRWASQRHPKGRPRKNTALSDVFRRLSRGPSDSRPHSGDQSSGADLEHTGQNFGGTAPDPNLPSAAGAGKTENAEETTTERRRIYFNMRLPEEETHDDGTPIHHYPRNKIRTAKYTPLTFIPKNLFLQFHNVANIYFFFIVILQVPPLSSFVDIDCRYSPSLAHQILVLEQFQLL
jgi:phospholipid-translocating ATPase